jgi:hypothetical protein
MFFDPLQRRFRARRMALLARTIGLTRDMRARYEIGEGETVVLGDGTSLPFADQSFDLVFSNSVIEHVSSRVEQARFAAEIARVGKRYWVQTPNRYFPIEHHLWTPFVHWLPRVWQGAILKRFSVWRMVTNYDAEQRAFYVNHYLDSIWLLSASDLPALFPGATLERERFLGWTKSLIAWRASGKPGVP